MVDSPRCCACADPLPTGQPADLSMEPSTTERWYYLGVCPMCRIMCDMQTIVTPAEQRELDGDASPAQPLPTE